MHMAIWGGFMCLRIGTYEEFFEHDGRIMFSGVRFVLIREKFTLKQFCKVS